MGETEIGEMLHYTIFFILLLVMSVMLIAFMQVSQVQTIQHTIESTLSKNGGYTKDALVKITGSTTAANSGQDLLPVNGSGWIFISKDYAQSTSAWESANGENPVTTAGTTNHWNLPSETNGDSTVEQLNTVIPYEVVVKPLGSGKTAGILFGWLPELKFEGSAQSQVTTGSVQ